MNYSVEHLATFSTEMPSSHQPITPKLALQRLFALEKTQGIWTQKMAIQIEGAHMLIYDRESNDIVEDFLVVSIQQPVAFSHSNHIYDNILMFTVQHPKESKGELHIFQCVSDYAQQIAEDLNSWMSKHGNTNQIIGNSTNKGQSNNGHNQPNSSPIKVKDAVSVFNAIAAQREKKPPLSPGSQQKNVLDEHNPEQDSSSVTTIGSANSGNLSGKHSGSDSVNSESSGGHVDHHNVSSGRPNSGERCIHSSAEVQAQNRIHNYEQSQLSTEKYVTILNHCFDEIERFSLRLQHAAAAYRELQLRNYKRKEKGGLSPGDGMVAMRARGPSEEQYFDILSKFKLAFNLLAKLKGYIHDPNAPELVHFLFTPLAIIIEAARNNPNVPIDATAVEMPFLHYEAIDLLSNCCTSKEFDLWQSLGPNWTQVRHIVNTPKMPIYQPIFIDGWNPVINEPELVGFTPTLEQVQQSAAAASSAGYAIEDAGYRRDGNRSHSAGRVGPYMDNEDLDQSGHLRHHPSDRISPMGRHHSLQQHHHHHHSQKEEVQTLESIELEQQHFLSELQQRKAKIVQVLYPRTANNDRELTVFRGEVLEVLDNTRNWWKAMNSKGQTAHVPNTIVKELDLKKSSSPPNITQHAKDNQDWARLGRQGKKGEFRYF